MEKKLKIIILFLIAIDLILFGIYKESQKEKYLEVSFLNVGQGDSIFIEAPNGVQMLIDSGPNNSVLREVGSLMNFGDRKIDIILGTHPDKDHIGGFPAILDRYEIKNTINTDVLSESSIYKTYKEKILEESSKNYISKRGGVIILDKEKGIYFQILSPDESFIEKDSNERSIVGRLAYGDTSFLLTGDAGITIENKLVLLDGELLESDILKLGHHGSKTSSSSTFLKQVNPELAIVSAGENNTYGHPHEVVIDRLEDLDINYLETKEGTLTFASNGEEVILLKNKNIFSFLEDVFIR